MTTNINYAVNYAGDFTTLTAAASGIGTDFTVTSTGLTLQTGSTTTSLVLSASEGASDYTGHPITIGGTQYLITAYSASTKIAAISARAGFPAALGATPASGTAYSIDSIAVALTIGQSSSVSNLWTVSTALTFSPTTSATCSLTLRGEVVWSARNPLRVNTSGALNAPACIQANGGYQVTISSNYVTVENLCAWNSLNGWWNATGTNQTWTNFAYQNDQAGGYGAFSNSGNSNTFNNCIFFSTSGSVACYGTGASGVANGCLFLNVGGSFPLLADNMTIYDSYVCTSATIQYKGAGNDGNFGVTPVRCAAPSTITSTVGGLTTLALAGLFNSTAITTADLRPLLSSGLLAAGGPRSTTADIFGVTRSTTASSIGPAENGGGPPAMITLAYSIEPGGDLYSPTPNGAVASSGGLTWSNGLVTMTAAAPHGLPVGAVVPLVVDQAFNLGGWLTAANSSGGGGYIYDVATVTGASTMTYERATDPGTLPTGTIYWFVHGLNYLMGAPTGGDLTYYQSGFTCPSTAADSSHIVLDTSVTPNCIGHPVTWNGQTGVITALSGNIATVSALAGHSGFSGIAAAGDSYTIYPTSIVFNIGAPVPGHRIWAIDVYHGNAGGISVGPAGIVTGPSNTITLNGTAPHDPAVALGTIVDTTGAITLKLGNVSDALSDHTAVLGIGVGYLTVNNLQLWCAVQSEPDGAIEFTANTIGNIYINNCVLRSDYGTNDEQHSPWIGQGSYGPMVGYEIVFTNCAMVAADYLAAQGMQCGHVTMNHCTCINTANEITTTTTDTPIGSNTMTLTSTANIGYLNSASGAGAFISIPSDFPAIGTGGRVQNVVGDVITLNGTVSADIPIGTEVLFSVWELCGGQDVVAANCAFFGFQTPTSNPSYMTATTCVTDSNPQSVPGFSLVSYPAQLRLGSAAFGTTVDLRPLSGNSLQHGTYMPAVPTDIYGNTRRNPPTIGCVEYTSGAISYSFVTN